MISYVDRMIGGTLSKALSSSNVTLTTDESRDLTLRLTGTLSADVTITTPGIGFYFIDNATTGSFTVTLQYTGAVGPITIPQGFVVPVIIDATNGVRNATGLLAGILTRQALFDAVSIKGADIVSASTINLETATGSLVDVTGTTTITAVTLSEGHERTVRFTGILTLTNGASLVLPGAANITTAAGDYAVFRGYSGGVVRCTDYQRAAQAPNAAASDSGAGPIEIAVKSEMEAASSVILAVTPGRQLFHPMHPKAGGSFNGTGTPAWFTEYGMAAITDTGTGSYTLGFDTAFASTSYFHTSMTNSSFGGRSNALNVNSSTPKTTSSIAVLAMLGDDSSASYDPSDASIVLWGSYP